MSELIPLAALGIDDATLKQLHKEAKRPPPGVHNIPSDKIRLSYYNEEDAKLMLGVIEFWRERKFSPMILDPASMIPPLQMNSLKTKVWNSKRYIMEVLMPGTETADICARIKFTANGGVWVMSLLDKAEKQSTNGMLAGCSFNEAADSGRIRSQFLEWIATPHQEREKLVIPEDPAEELSLSDEDIEFFRERAAEIKNLYISKITRTRIVVIRHTPESQPPSQL